MAKPKPHLNSKPASKGGSSKRKKKQKGKTQPKPPMERVMVMGPSGKTRMEWRPWGS